MTIGKLLRAGLQSGTIMGIADASTQLLIDGKNIATGTPLTPSIKNCSTRKSDLYDGKRTLRWFFMGLLLHGPYFWAGFSVIDRSFAGKSWEMIAKKTAVAQFFLFPPYLVALFATLGVLEQNPDIFAKIRSQVPEAFLSGCIYWPIANSINFRIVPNTLRVPYLALSAGIWNSYLNYTNYHERGRNATRNDS